MRKLEDLNFYELLDVDPQAGAPEIERAFNGALKTYRAGSLAVYSVLSEEERERILSRVQQAYAVLADKHRRVNYDEQLRLTGNPTQAALESARSATGESGQESSNSLWGRVRQVFPAPESMGTKVSRFLRSRGPKRSELSISSGHYLKSVRMLKGITLEEISERTKIKTRYLEALEKEDYESLPAGVYRRYILKALADAIDLDPEAVADDFQGRISR